jgi:hypothetical protein
VLPVAALAGYRGELGVFRVVVFTFAELLAEFLVDCDLSSPPSF